MRSAVTYSLIASALFSSSLSYAAGGSQTTMGAIFATLGILTWAEALLLDIAWDA